MADETITHTRPIRVFPEWSSLIALASDDLAGRDALIAFLARLPGEVALPSLGALISEPSSCLRRERIVAPPSELADRDGVAFAISGKDAGQSFRCVVVLPAELVRTLLKRTLGRDFAPLRSISSGETGVLLHVLDQIAKDLLAASIPAFIIRGPLHSPEQIAPYLGRPAAALSIRLVTGADSWRVLLLTSAVPTPPGEESGISCADARLLTWPVAFRLVCGHCRMSRSAVQRLGVGDLLVPDQLVTPWEENLADRDCFTLVNGARILPARWRDTGAVEVGSEKGYDEGMGAFRTYSGAVENPASSTVEADNGVASTVCVRIELGRVVLPVSEATKLMPGSVIRLEKPLANQVVLYCEDMPVATGTIVRSGEELAVEIEELT